MRILDLAEERQHFVAILCLRNTFLPTQFPSTPWLILEIGSQLGLKNLPVTSLYTRTFTGLRYPPSSERSGNSSAILHILKLFLRPRDQLPLPTGNIPASIKLYLRDYLRRSYSIINVCKPKRQKNHPVKRTPRFDRRNTCCS